ncbi:unnamed protein product [Parnassius mnemosyne]|uniref:TIR domain-containing protein n=1 Tax=Parnassius mnemosyne TaxID=213953 RepID=A0AAV1LFQ5_9NEOP
MIRVISPQPPPHIPKCLTGYMTDVQSWTDYDGRLIVYPDDNNSIDVSYHLDCVGQLQRQLRQFPCSGNNSVQYLSMANCQFHIIPSVFHYKDSCGNTLSGTVEYLTLTGNNFSIEYTFHPYDVQMNATNAKSAFEDTSFERNIANCWSNGLRGVTFPRLRELDLRLCRIRKLEDSMFSGMPYLEKLYLGENNIFLISAGTFSGLKRLIHLDFSRNYEFDEYGTYQGLYFDECNVFQELVNIESIDFSFTKMAQRNIDGFRHVSAKLQRLSICHAGLSNLIPGLLAGTSLKFLDVSGNINIFADDDALRGLEHSLQVVYANDIALKKLDVFENMKSLEILRARNNEITTIGRKIARSLVNLQVIDLDMNRLIAWSRPTVSLMPSLKFLSVRSNNINVISEQMARDFENVSYIGLTGNYIVCNCNAREIFELALRNEMDRKDELIEEKRKNQYANVSLLYHSGYEDVNYAIANRKYVRPNCIGNNCYNGTPLEISGKFLLFDYDKATYNCLTITDGKTKSFARVPSCKETKDMEVGAAIQNYWNKYLLIIPLLLMPFLIIGFVFKRNLRYFFITIRNSAMLSLINKNEHIDENTIFNYDVFVSYSNEDRAWVLDYLLPHLETDCNVSVCLHERDFLVGLSILENIVACMDRSRAIMLIISQRFLVSQWCQFEMHLAQHRLLETRREDLILVLLEDIPRRLRPNTLHYLMVTNTYIVWPKEDAEQVLFWRRLKKSLVTQKMKQPENVSLA